MSKRQARILGNLKRENQHEYVRAIEKRTDSGLGIIMFAVLKPKLGSVMNRKRLKQSNNLKS